MVLVNSQKILALKVLLVLACILLTPATHAELFKCTDAKGKISFQDKPCNAAEKSDAVNIKKTKWTSHIEGAKPQGVHILKLSGDEDDATIHFTFKENFELKEFMQTVNKMSNRGVTLLSVKMPNAASNGEGKMRVTNKDIGPLKKRK